MEEPSLLQTYVLDGGPTMIFIAFALLALIALVLCSFFLMIREKFFR